MNPLPVMNSMSSLNNKPFLGRLPSTQLSTMNLHTVNHMELHTALMVQSRAHSYPHKTYVQVCNIKYLYISLMYLQVWDKFYPIPVGKQVRTHFAIVAMVQYSEFPQYLVLQYYRCSFIAYFLRRNIVSSCPQVDAGIVVDTWQYEENSCEHTKYSNNNVQHVITSRDMIY